MSDPAGLQLAQWWGELSSNSSLREVAMFLSKASWGVGASIAEDLASWVCGEPAGSRARTLMAWG